MRLKVDSKIPRWRKKLFPQEEKRLHFPLNIGDDSSIQFGSQSTHESTPISSQNEATPTLEKCFVTSWEKRDEMEKIFGPQGGGLFDKFEIISKQKNNIGPGTYDITQWPENILNKTGASVKRNFGFGSTPRFFNSVKSCTPGPGYVGKNHNPFYYIEEKRKKGFSSLPTFERDGLAPRNRKEKNFSLPPNRYNAQHPDCLDNFLKKQISKRGPYDLFTGPRDRSTIKGYFIAPIIFDHPDWPNNFPGEIEKLLHKSNNFKGVFEKSARFPKKPTSRIAQSNLNSCYRDPLDPGPGHYDPQVTKGEQNLKKYKKYPFGKACEGGKKLGNLEVRPCPGQYDPKYKIQIKGSGWTWAFKSKLPRTKSLEKEPYNNF